VTKELKKKTVKYEVPDCVSAALHLRCDREGKLLR